ncbi:uncharacterized protein LOC123602913 [Leopardus geoffroyi]|uniref:uncharacterized protein LOC123602913 n=1 Tax=Leopardus geoffroyi TaxID=46844 RepID=UPI001E2643FA|nr:uncharacterized protein LOC123602913 [Leopardus geoffroyi]
MPPPQPPRWLPLPQPRSQSLRAAGPEPRAHWRAAVASQLDGYPDRTHFPIGRWGLWDSPGGSPGESEYSAPGPGIALRAPGHPLSKTPELDRSRRAGPSSGRAWAEERLAAGAVGAADPGLRSTLLSFLLSAPRDPLEAVDLLQGLRARTRGPKRVKPVPEPRSPRSAEEQREAPSKGPAGASGVWEGVEARAGLCWLLACKVLPTSHPVSQFFPLEFQYGWEGSRRTGASRGCSRTPLLPGERVLEYLQLSTRAHARVPPEPRPAPPSRVPGLSQLLLPLTASAAPKGCRCPGAERRGSAGRWSEVGRRGRRALDVRKALPHLWEGGHGGGTKKDPFRKHMPGIRGRELRTHRAE